jgi:hypothetical protein
MLQTSPTSQAAIDLRARLNETVSLPVAARLLGIAWSTVYADAKSGLLTLAPRRKRSTRRRVTLRTLAEWGADISPEAVANAEETFAAIVAKGNARARALRRAEEEN